MCLSRVPTDTLAVTPRASRPRAAPSVTATLALWPRLRTHGPAGQRRADGRHSAGAKDTEQGLRAAVPAEGEPLSSRDRAGQGFPEGAARKEGRGACRGRGRPPHPLFTSELRLGPFSREAIFFCVTRGPSGGEG